MPSDAPVAKLHAVRRSTLVRLLGVGERGIKTDQRDAQQLSKASWQTDVRRSGWSAATRRSGEIRETSKPACRRCLARLPTFPDPIVASIPDSRFSAAC